MRDVLEPGTLVEVTEGEYYRITGEPIGSGGGSLVYPCVRMFRKNDAYSESTIRYALKECFPVSAKYSFIRKADGTVCPEDGNEAATQYLKVVQEMQLREQQAANAVYEKGFRLIPIVSQSNTIHLSFDCGASFHSVSNAVTIMESPDNKGKSLKAHLDEAGGKLPLRTAFHVIEQVLFAVNEVHAAGYLHLDIQDGNIFVKGSLSEENDMVSLIDLGSARECLEDGRTAAISDGVLFSTEGFSAPEMLDHNDGSLRLGPETDIYSIGYLLLLLLTGERYERKELAAAADGRIITGKTMRQMECPKHLADRLQRILATALAETPAERYRNCEAMRQEVSDFLQALRPYRSDLAAVPYDAFISYRHGEIDSPAAFALQRNLEHFGPRGLEGFFRKGTKYKPIQRVFVDEGELSSGADFGIQIREALKNSGWLIVICSPGTKDSPWVDLEIRTFLEFHDRSRLLAVVTDGEPEEVFPNRLREGNDMFLAADARDDKTDTGNPNKKSDLRKILKNLQGDALLKIAAPMLGTTFDTLKQRNRTYLFQRAAAAAVFAAVLLLGITVYTLYQSHRVNEQYRQNQIYLARSLSENANDQLDKGDRIGALETLVESAQGDLDREEAIVPEQMYALNRALYTYQHSDNYIYNPMCIQTLDRLNTTVNEVSPDGKTFFCLDDLGNAYFYDTGTGKLHWRTNASDFLEDDTAFVWGGFCGNSKIVMATDEEYCILDVDRRVCQKNWKITDDEYPQGYDISGNTLAVSMAIYADTEEYDSYEVYLYDLTADDPAAEAKKYRLPGNFASGSDVVLSDDASEFAVCLSSYSDDGEGDAASSDCLNYEIQIVDSSNLQIIQKISGEGDVKCMEFLEENFLGVIYLHELSTITYLFDYERGSGQVIYDNLKDDTEDACRGIKDLGKIYINDGYYDCIAIYDQEELTVLQKKEWNVVSVCSFDSVITECAAAGDELNILILLDNGEVYRLYAGEKWLVMSIEQDSLRGYFSPEANAVIYVGKAYVADTVTFSRIMKDENMTEKDEDVPKFVELQKEEEQQEEEWESSRVSGILLTGEKYCCVSSDDPTIKVQSVPDGETVLEIENAGFVPLCEFLEDEKYLLIYNYEMAKVTIWDIDSGQIVTSQTMDFKVSYKETCQVDTENRRIILSNTFGTTYTSDENYAACMLDILCYDENMQIYQLASIPYGIMDPETGKIFSSDGYASEYCSYSELLQRAQETIDAFRQGE